MNIVTLEAKDRAKWNAFIAEEFPPVGAFLETWEWGNFKESLYGNVTRYAIVEDGEWLACFHLETHPFPFGLTYGYAPRGPVLKKELWDDESMVGNIFGCIATYLKQSLSHLMFVRFEPSHKKSFACYEQAPFQKSPSYLQPRFNQLITLYDSEALLKTFVADVRHDIRAAERIAIAVTDGESLTPEEAEAFEKMKIDTRNRSHRNIFPSDKYFSQLLESFKTAPEDETYRPFLRFFVASKQGVPVAIYLSVMFGNTLTYLYGASYSGSISKRAPAYLHWRAMQYAHSRGLTYYDLGGVDDTAWKGLTYFKKQFGGETLEYIGTVNAVLRPFSYSLYVFIKKCSAAVWYVRENIAGMNDSRRKSAK
jgi:lipid II:glycine glycyltransferase (peptidoglycan interpeptide bridge formation enzyme)